MAHILREYVGAMAKAREEFMPHLHEAAARPDEEYLNAIHHYHPWTPG